MAMEEHHHQHQPVAATAIVTTGKKGKKKPPAPAKKPAEPDKATSITEEHQPPLYSDGSRIMVSEFDHCVENHFKAIHTIAELCGEPENSDAEIDETDIQRFSSSIIFLREWRFFEYEPKTVKFASELRGPEAKDADISIRLPQFSSAAVHKNRAPPKAAASLDYRNFVMYVGGPIWALDWCPQDHEGTDSLFKCEFIAVSAHPPGSSYHKMGIPLTGRGMVQIWCLVHGTECYDAEPIITSKASSDVPSPPKKPRGRPRGSKKSGTPKLPSKPKGPRGRPKKKQEESNDNRGSNCQLSQNLSSENPVGSSNLLEIDSAPKNSELENSVERQSITLLEFSTCSSEDEVPTQKRKVRRRVGTKNDEVPAQKRRVRRKVGTKNHIEDLEKQEDGSNAINAQANKNVASESSGEDSLLCNNITENAVLDTSSVELSIPESVALPRLVLCLAHNGKVAWDLKWKPTNACQAQYKHRMGYLAVLLGNGSLEVWEVPSPHVVKAIYSKVSGETTDPRFVKLKPVFRCSMLKSANTQSIPLTVEWSSTPPYDRLLVGCHDGTVALWKFSANSTCEDTRPLLRFSADTVPIRGIAWAPDESDPECENMMLTAGHGGLKFWDLRDPFRPLWDLRPVPRMIYSLEWLLEPRCLVLSFDDGTLKLLDLLKAAYDVPVTGKPFTKINQKGLHTYCCTSSAIWSAQVSRQTGMVAYCSADGTVVRFQLTSKAVVKANKRDKTPHFVCDYLTEEESTITIHTPESDDPFPLKKATRDEPLPTSMGAMLTGSQSNKAHSDNDDDSVESGSEDTPISIKKNKSQSKCKKGGVENQDSSDERNDPQKNSGDPGSGNNFESMPPRSVAVHRVRWNMDLGSERWLCHGGAAGLLRAQEILLSPLDKKLMKKR